MDIYPNSYINSTQNNVSRICCDQAINRTDASFPDILNIACNTAISNVLSAEETLRSKYPKLTYNVFAFDNPDFERCDFPFQSLFSSPIPDSVNSWRGQGPKPSGFEDHIQNTLAQIDKDLVSVAVHPEIQIKMNEDRDYAQKIAQKIDRWIVDDISYNEQLIPGSTEGASRFISIDRYGNISNCVTITPAGPGDFENVMTKHNEPDRYVVLKKISNGKPTWPNKISASCLDTQGIQDSASDYIAWLNSKHKKTKDL